MHRIGGGAGVSPRGRDFIEIVRELATMAGVPFPGREFSEEEKEKARKRDSRRAILQTVILHAKEVLWSPAGDAARAYLHERGFSDEDIDALDLGLYLAVSDFRTALQAAGHDLSEAATCGVLREQLEGYILFPWADEYGHPLTIYGSWQNRTPPAHKPKKTALWNPKNKDGDPWEQTKRSPLYFDRARKAGHKDLVLVEGVTDAALAQCRGESRVIACVAAELWPVAKVLQHWD
jgi:DNA primase